MVNAKVLALAGGVGGSKLVLGLSKELQSDQLAVAVNTGDDDKFYGLHISPDLDTMMYTLAGLSNLETGWGLAGETFRALDMLRRYGADTWFNLGDQDLGTHLRRTQLLGEGLSLSEVTFDLFSALGIEQTVIPMSDDPVPTVLHTIIGPLKMQEYFVQHGSKPKVALIQYQGATSANPAPAFDKALADAGLVVFCPSNPFLSIGPILAISGIRERFEGMAGQIKRVAVSPIIGGAAVQGPAAKIMEELGHEVSAIGVARWYQGLCDVFVIDEQDADLAPQISELGMKAVVTSTVMKNEADKVALAQFIVGLDEEGR